MISYVIVFVCFFKQKTAYEMRISDWSSDVCSSDLHAPEPEDGLAEPDDRHRRGWRQNPPDQYNNHFGPLIRLTTGLWRRLAERDRILATRIAESWAGRDAMIFKRSAAWSATISKAGPAEAVDGYIRLNTRDRYWFGDKNPELVRFYCRGWNRLDQRNRA